MARRGDGIYQRGRTWWLDFIHEEKRHYVRLGRNISKTVAGEIAKVKRGAILKGEAGIGGTEGARLSFTNNPTGQPDPAPERTRPQARRRLVHKSSQPKPPLPR